MSGYHLEAIRGLRVAHIIESDGPGGAERMVVDFAVALRRAGCENLAVLPVDGEGWLGRELAGNGIAAEGFDYGHLVDLGSVRTLARLLRSHRIEVAHSHEFTMAVYGALAARAAGIPHVITMHGSQYFNTRLRRRLGLRLAVSWSGATVAVSGELARAMSRDLWLRPERIRVIPNGVSFTPAHRSSLREELCLGPGDRLAVAVGNLYPVKGHVHLLDALGLLRVQLPQLHVAIAGRGNLDTALRARADELGLSDRFHLLGFRKDVANILAGADVFVLPSLSEGLPLALLEAMAAWCPIVASDVGEVRTALDDGRAGLLVSPGDARSLANSLARVVGHGSEADRLRAAAGNRAAAEYGLSTMVERYVRVYKRLLRESRGNDGGSGRRPFGRAPRARGSTTPAPVSPRGSGPATEVEAGGHVKQ